MLDLILLRIVKHRKEFMRLYDSIPSTSVDVKTKALLDDFGKYFKKFPDHESIQLDVFIPRFRQWHPGLTEEQFTSYKGILRQISDDVPESTRNGILGELYELKMGTEVANAIADYEAGELRQPLLEVLSASVDSYKINNGIKHVSWCDLTAAELIEDDSNAHGLKWRLNCLNDAMRPLVAGDFGILAGRPDKGKTTLLASEMTFMAPQLAPEKNVLWLNNEGPGKRIKKRLYCSALGLTWSEIVEMIRSNKPVHEAYGKVIGRPDRIRIIDIHGMHVSQVEAIIETNNPGLVVYDMIDHIKGFGDEARTDLQLEAMYNWGRERGVKYDFAGIATSQISADGENVMYPELSMLKDSKTGKQGACDWQMMIGSSKDENLRYSRFISLPKNKLRRDDAPSDPHCEVVFKPTISRFEDVPDGE